MDEQVCGGVSERDPEVELGVPQSVALGLFPWLKAPAGREHPTFYLVRRRGKSWGSLDERHLGTRGAGCDFHFVFLLAFPRPECSECHPHLQSYPVHLTPGLSWVWWLTLAFLSGPLGFQFLQTTRSVPTVFPSSQSLLTFDFW